MFIYKEKLKQIKLDIFKEIGVFLTKHITKMDNN